MTPININGYTRREERLRHVEAIKNGSLWPDFTDCWVYLAPETWVTIRQSISALRRIRKRVIRKHPGFLRYNIFQ